MVFTMVIDVSGWLKLHEGKMMFTLDNPDSRLQYYITSWEDVLEWPFKTPSKMDINHFSNCLANLRSRTDTFSIITSAVDHYFNRVTWIRNQDHFNTQEDVGLRAIKKKIEWILQFTDGSF